MNINYKLKSTIFKIIDELSLHKILYFIQKYITRRSKINIKNINHHWIVHKSNMLLNMDEPRIIEFGAGKNLAQNIYLSRFFRSQVVVDLFPMLDIEQFNIAALQISLLDDIHYKKAINLDEIEKYYNIEYISPLDMTKSHFADNSFDGCISTNTLEHIPYGTILGIFRELQRIIVSGGLISAVVDYSDHYSHTDRKISKIEFLRYNDEQYKKFNHSIHYQNRLRHSDFEEIFKLLGFKVLESKASDFEKPPEEISSQFNANDKNIFATQGVFLLQVLK